MKNPFQILWIILFGFCGEFSLNSVEKFHQILWSTFSTVIFGVCGESLPDFLENPPQIEEGIFWRILGWFSEASFLNYVESLTRFWAESLPQSSSESMAKIFQIFSNTSLQTIKRILIEFWRRILSMFSENIFLNYEENPIKIHCGHLKIPWQTVLGPSMENPLRILREYFPGFWAVSSPD